ncbi:MAG TPA: hypothetical protein PLZ92_03100 [Phycicoccus sp.]|nr:hypothetical protein [Phycicoccus sp.]
MRRRGIVAPLIAVVLAVGCLLAGHIFAGILNGQLAIRFEDKALPPEPTTTVTPATKPAPVDSLSVEGIVLDTTGPSVLTRALEAVREANRGRERTAVTRSLLLEPVETPAPAPAQAPGASASPSTTTKDTDEGFTLTQTNPTTVLLKGSTRGIVNGLHHLADSLRSGNDWTALADGQPRQPALAHRFLDTGAVGVVPDPTAYAKQDDYAHTSGALASVVLDHAPWLDEAALAQTTKDWHEFVDRGVAYGYNGIFVPGFLEYVSFDTLGTGTEVYPADSPERARQTAMRERIGPLWRYAHDQGLDVVFKTDMLALSTRLERYLTTKFGSIDANDPRLWEVYEHAIDELFTSFPWASGMMIRIGEAGAIYNAKNWDYYSALKVTDTQGVQTMLRTASAAAARHDKTIYFRTWSVGIGDVGDMHTNPQTYERVLGDLDLPNLVVSTKFTTGDFDSFLPLNPTLTQGTQPRIVEMQGRREFEAFSSIPDDMGPTHQAALQHFRAANPNISGLWMWTQDGGPWRAGPMSLYLKSGFWQLYDLNVYAAGRLAWDPDVDLAQVNCDWIRQTLTSDPASIDAVAEILSQSRQAVLDGLYIRPYAEKAVFALGLEPPPMMWIFKWDIVSGDAAGLSAVYLATKGRVDEAIDEGRRAVTSATQMRATLASVDRATFTDPKLYDELAASLDYEVDLFTTLQTYRTAFLHYYEWLDGVEGASSDQWQSDVAAYRAASAAHTKRWGGNLDLPPYNFFVADAGLVHVERAVWTMTAGRLLLALCALVLIVVKPLRRGAFLPWRLRADMAPTETATPRWQRLATLIVPVLAILGSRLAFSSGASTAYLLVTLGSLAILAITARLALALLRPGADATALWAGLGGVLTLRTLWLAGALSVSGPGGYWLRFWTDESWRTVYVTVGIGLLLWSLVVVGLTFRHAYAVSRLAALGVPLLGFGLPLLALGGLMAGVGLENALTTINNQMAVLPLGLSKILGLVTHLGIPRSLPVWLMQAGGAVALLGALAVLPHTLRSRRRPSTT